MPSFYGYHGTDMLLGEKIVEEKKFHLSLGDDHWLGDGIYFFEDHREALLWAKICRKFPTPVVIEVSIISDRVFDLTKIDDQIRFDEFIAVIESKLDNVKKEELRQQSKRKGIGGYINMLYKLEPFEVVRAVFNSHLRLKYIRSLMSSLSPAQIQLCVRGHSAILEDSIVVRRS